MCRCLALGNQVANIIPNGLKGSRVKGRRRARRASNEITELSFAVYFLYAGDYFADISPAPREIHIGKDIRPRARLDFWVNESTN